MTTKNFLQDAKAQLVKATQTGNSIGDRVNTALTWLEAALEVASTDEEKEEIEHLRCLAHCANDNYDAAQETFDKANSGREIPMEWKTLGSLLYAKTSLPSDLRVALEECDKAIGWLVEDGQSADWAPVRAILYGRKAYCHLRMDRVADAMACCNIASRLLPEHLAPLRIMAEIMMRQGNHQAAIEYLSLTIANRPEGPHFWDHANRGNAFLETDNVKEALLDLELALQLDPNSPVVLSNLGLAMNRMGDITKAWRFFNLALMENYHWVPAHNNRGTLFFESNDYRAAEREFSTAIELDNRNATLWFNRGLSRFEQKMYGECLSDMAIASRLGNQSWETLYISEMCKGHLQEYSSASAILKTLALNAGLDRRTTSLVWNNMGVIEHRANDLKRAQSCFHEALADDPLNEQAQANLDRLESSMSGADLQATQEEPLELRPRPTMGEALGLTPSDVLSTVNIATTLATLMT